MLQSNISYKESIRNKTLFSYSGEDQSNEGEHKMEFETIEPNVWKPEQDGDFIEGVLIAKKEKLGPNESKAYYLEKDSSQVLVWGSTVLDSRMEFVDIRSYLKITFKGTQKNNKGQDTKIFKVEKAKLEGAQ